jgi:DNA-binding transcriptional regulator YiaG
MQESNSLIHRRKRLDAAQVAQLIEQYKASGMTQREFAASANIGYSTLTGWLHRRRRSPVQQAKSWVAVDVVKPTPSPALGLYQLELPNGARLSVGAGFDGPEVAQLIKWLSACSA